MAITPDTLRELGYDVQVAFGDVEVEKSRRNAIARRGRRAAREQSAEQVARDVSEHLRASGRRDEEIIEIASRAAAETLETLKVSDGVEIDHADRAIAEAEAMPTVYRVDGYGISTYVAGDDQAALAALADPEAHAERKRQHEE
jgi:hypothetical protein